VPSTKFRDSFRLTGIGKKTVNVGTTGAAYRANKQEAFSFVSKSRAA
jgi:hypothetical protein